MEFSICIVGKGSWKNEKLESLRLENLKLKSFRFSLKVPSKIGKFSWKLQTEFEKLK